MAWSSRGTLQGPQGIQGIQGATGAQGIQGPQGPAGATEASYPVTVFDGNWSNYPGFPPLRYQLIGTRVFLRGVIRNTFAAGPRVTMFTLPAGVRPAAYAELFAVVVNGAAARVDVNSAGQVILDGTVPAGAYVSLSGITFSTL